ncbi:unnamed protein product, partial [Symbiodinium necroappetens]
VVCADAHRKLYFEKGASRQQRRATGVDAPVNRAEERLFAVVIPELPHAPIAEALEVARSRVVRELVAAVGLHPASLLCATDGSAKEDVAGWAVAVEGAGAHAGILAGEDHDSFLAETFGLLVLFQALAEVADGVTLPPVKVLCDCKSALRLCEVEYNGEWSPPQGVSGDRARLGLAPPGLFGIVAAKYHEWMA